MKKSLLILLFFLTFSGPTWTILSGKIDFSADWRTANRDSAHIAPKPDLYKDAVIQVYSARAFNWRGIFSKHLWIATKEKNAAHYTVYQVIGWRIYYGLPALIMAADIPDRKWFGEIPDVILDIRGEKAEGLIPNIIAAAKRYPYPDHYDVWPGPNSNTFPAFIARSVPDLHLSLPANAIGKDFLTGWTVFAKSPSGTGYQVSIFGLLGVLIAKEEGLEVNLLGLVYGIKWSKPAILLPGFGEIPLT